MTTQNAGLSELLWAKALQCESPWSGSQWEFCAHAHTSLGEQPDLSARDEWAWHPTKFPFGLISALRELEILPDPTVGSSDLACAWIEECDWLLRSCFNAPAGYAPQVDELSLHLRNVDCFADIYLNGTKIGRSRNAFREHSFDIEELNLDTSNELLIYFRSAKLVTEAFEAAHGALPSGFDTARVHARRSQCLTGWDWAPRLSGVSLLSPPCLQKHSLLEINALYVWCNALLECQAGQVTVESAKIHLSVEMTSKRRTACAVSWCIIDEHTGEVVYEVDEDYPLRAKTVVLKHEGILENAKLWWPLAMGNQPLYRLVIQVTTADPAGDNIEVVDSVQFGVRTATVEKTKNAESESFIPLINGVPVFCRGTNWIPASMLPADVGMHDYEQLIGSAATAGMNCLRVWGGGIYEPGCFYETCDRLGILVWQDFMFACAAYPVYREFLDEVEAEGIYQVKRLRNHACLLLWCGNNENEWLHQVGSLKKGNEQRIIGEVIWSTILKSVVEEYDPSREYHQSSPFGRNRQDFNDELSGDRHNWDPWSGWQSPDAYLIDEGRFLSEFGFQGMPALESIRKFAPTAESGFDPMILHHQKMVLGQERLVRYMAELSGVPSDFTEWIEATQDVQAEVLRRAVEHWRRLRFHCAGTLIWQNHDSYPAISWSLIDYYRQPKTAYFAAKRFFSPILMSVGLLVKGQEVGAFPPSVWPKESGPPQFKCGNGDPISLSETDFQLSARILLINDSCLELGGEVHIRISGGGENEPSLDTVSVFVPANQSSPLIIRNFSDYQITDIRRAWIEIEFEPETESLARVDIMDESIRNKLTSVIKTNMETFGGFNLKEGFKFRMMLVEKLHQQQG